MRGGSNGRGGRTGKGKSKRLRLVAVVLVALALVAAIAYGAAANGLEPNDQTPAVGNNQPIPVEPDGGIGDTPIPVTPVN